MLKKTDTPRIDPGAVAFDIDGVVADTMALFLDIARETHRIDHLRYEDFTCYELDRCLDIDSDVLDEIIRQLIEGGYSKPLKPIKGAGEVLGRISRAHQPLLFVTARPQIGPMHTWVQTALGLAPDTYDIIATGSYEAKLAVLLEHNVAYFVEDRLETCFHICEAGVVPILFKQPWNRQEHPFAEVDNWRELERMIDF
jgi:uncharacterized protein